MTCSCSALGPQVTAEITCPWEFKPIPWGMQHPPLHPEIPGELHIYGLFWLQAPAFSEFLNSIILPSVVLSSLSRYGAQRNLFFIISNTHSTQRWRLWCVKFTRELKQWRFIFLWCKCLNINIKSYTGLLLVTLPQYLVSYFSPCQSLSLLPFLLLVLFLDSLFLSPPPNPSIQFFVS